jgi:hypothetical protein
MAGAPEFAGISKLKRIVSSSSQEVISEDPLVVAANFVTLISGGARRPSIWLTGLREPTACACRTGAGVSFRFDSEEGVSGIFYFFPDFASAKPDGEASERPPIPTKMIIDRVAGYADALDTLLRTVPRPPDLKQQLAKDPELSQLLKYL